MSTPISIRQRAGLLLAYVGCVLPGLFLATPASADTLVDPTRPPNGFDPNRAADAGMGGTSGGAGTVLQSVLISPTRKLAIISGKTVKLGEEINGARLVSLTETQAVLRRGNNLETLKLFSGINKQMQGSRAVRSRDREQHR